jgi:hypothetical protein
MPCFDSAICDILYWGRRDDSQVLLRRISSAETSGTLAFKDSLVMNRYSSLCDDFYVNMNLSTEMELPNNRETILHYFERIQKTYPTMRNFYCRERGDFVLEEDKDRGQYRWCTVEARRVCSGQVNPVTVDEALEQHRLVLELAPYMLSVSPLDCEALDLLYGFDFTYRGNHNELVAEALGVSQALERLVEQPGSVVLNYEPSLTLALDEECRLQCRMSIETRTNAYQVRTGEYPEDQLSVYLTARQYGSLGPEATYVTALEELSKTCHEMVDSYVIENVLRPLAQAIAMK